MPPIGDFDRAGMNSVPFGLSPCWRASWARSPVKTYAMGDRQDAVRSSGAAFGEPRTGRLKLLIGRVSLSDLCEGAI